MRNPPRPDGNLELACLWRGLRRGSFSDDRGILLPRDNWRSRNRAAPLGSLVPLNQPLFSVYICL